jgi:hypothetical protein
MSWQADELMSRRAVIEKVSQLRKGTGEKNNSRVSPFLEKYNNPNLSLCEPTSRWADEPMSRRADEQIVRLPDFVGFIGIVLRSSRAGGRDPHPPPSIHWGADKPMSRQANEPMS